ncbi:hypothetical protein Q8W71_24430 [Methylobacterium sp. NEAU 140]|uniref:hypothetical protein n=1 Tax=Methylobacterium sp. NEAU 140 TaxID=3064945 RepID=UPI00273732AF|nr:hypothetical protein [Methylobacterium sp. NEAU 140]MDP4025783.1 hypothetical protein [Methylobacterium sp. NEAU 140]
MRTALRIAALAGGLALAGAAPAEAQSRGNNCLVRQAADAAVQRQIALIDAAKVNPSAFFNGPNSCIAGDLLKRFDLSNLIPDLSGFLTSAATNLISSVIDAAKRQVCQILDDQLRDTIRSINQQMGSFQSSITGDLFRQLNGSISPITIPNINGIGSYNLIQNSAFGSALNLGQSTQSASPVVVQQSAPVPAAAPAVSAPATSGGNFGGMFQ